MQRGLESALLSFWGKHSCNLMLETCRAPCQEDSNSVQQLYLFTKHSSGPSFTSVVKRFCYCCSEAWERKNVNKNLRVCLAGKPWMGGVERAIRGHTWPQCINPMLPSHYQYTAYTGEDSFITKARTPQALILAPLCGQLFRTRMDHLHHNIT